MRRSQRGSVATQKGADDNDSGSVATAPKTRKTVKQKTGRKRSATTAAQKRGAKKQKPTGPQTPKKTQEGSPVIDLTDDQERTPGKTGEHCDQEHTPGKTRQQSVQMSPSKEVMNSLAAPQLPKVTDETDAKEWTEAALSTARASWGTTAHRKPKSKMPVKDLLASKVAANANDPKLLAALEAGDIGTYDVLTKGNTPARATVPLHLC